MSIKTERTGKPSRNLNDEGGKDRTEQSRESAQRSGGVSGEGISPLLANLYLDGLEKAVNGGKQMKAVMVRYADDFVVLCGKGQGTEMHARLKSWLEKKGLKLNDKKTRIVDFEKESLEFLGFRLAWRKARNGRSFPL